MYLHVSLPFPLVNLKGVMKTDDTLKNFFKELSNQIIADFKTAIIVKYFIIDISVSMSFSVKWRL